MHRTHRQAALVGQGRMAMGRREERRATAMGDEPILRPRGHSESEQVSRWENEGGAVGHTARERPRPLR